MIVPFKNAKSYGVVHTEDFFTFSGFTKSVTGDEIQKVDVFLDDELINTIDSNKNLQKIDNIYDIQNFSFSYLLPVEYIDGTKHKISFKNHQTKEELQNSPYILIDRNYKKFNELKFLHNLNFNLDIENFQAKNHKDSIGFLATIDNLEDLEFIKFMNILFEKDFDIRYKAFYFSDEEKHSMSNVFNKYISKIDFIKPNNIYDIVENISIYIHSSVPFAKPKNGIYHKIWQTLNKTKANLFKINLYDEIKNVNQYSNSLKLIDDSKIKFEESVVSEIFKNDEKYNELYFINSLNQPTSEEIQSMYYPDSIGFLATKENLEDREFMNYIKELMKRFPNIEFKKFTFLKNVNKNFIKINYLEDIISNACVLIINPLLINNKLDKIVMEQQEKFQNVFISPYNKQNQNKQIKDIVNLKIVNSIKNNLKLFDLSEEDIKDIPDNHILMIRKSAEKCLNIKHIDQKSLLEMTLNEYTYINIKNALTNQKFIKIQKNTYKNLLKLEK